MFKYLKMAETRRDTVSRYNPGSSEEIRMERVVDEIRSSFTKDQLEEYENSKLPVLSAAEQRAKNAEDLARMEQNKDSVSI